MRARKWPVSHPDWRGQSREYAAAAVARRSPWEKQLLDRRRWPGRGEIVPLAEGAAQFL